MPHRLKGFLLALEALKKSRAKRIEEKKAKKKNKLRRKEADVGYKPDQLILSVLTPYRR